MSDSKPAQPAPAFRWVPIRSLSSRHRPRILAHLLRLSEHDRYLRFGHVATDSQVGQYVDRLDFERDEIFGVFNRRLQIIAMVHLAYLGPGRDGRPAAEFGVSVNERARGRGIGARLFDHAVLHARNRGVDTLIVHALTENTPMLRIAASAGATVERSGGEAEAVLRLPPEDLASRVEEFIEGGKALLDYSLKHQVRHIDELLTTIDEVRTQITHAPRGPSP
jgi:GNAT superfamily N-acetyltransferase